MYGNEVPNELGKTRLLDFDNELWKFIFYPSVVNDRKSVNVAVHPELVDKNTFALNKVLKIQLNPMTVDELLNSPKIEFGILEVGDVIGKNDELISWREPVGTDYNYI